MMPASPPLSLLSPVRGNISLKSFKLMTSICIIIILLLTNYIPNVTTHALLDKEVNIEQLLYSKPSLVNVSLPERLLSDQADLSSFYVDGTNIYVFGRNVLYHVNAKQNYSGLANFELIKQVDIRPANNDNCVEVESQHACPCSRDNVVTSIFAHKDLLLGCGSRSQGRCIIIKKSDISVNRAFFNPSQMLPSDVVASSKTSVIFPGILNGKTMFYSGFENDCERPFTLNADEPTASVPFISARSLTSKSLVYSFKDANFRSKLDLHPHHRNRTKTKFIYGFDTDDYAYFITVQKNHNILETRIGRICHDNVLLNAYTEVILKCDRNTIASSATHFDHVLFNRSLIVSFDSENQNSSSICMFQLSQIDEAFVNATKNCFESGSHSRLLPAFYDNDPPCENIDFVDINKFLCKRDTNHFILGEIPIDKKSFFVLKEDRITSITAHTDHMNQKNDPFILLLSTLKSNFVRLDVKPNIGGEFSVAVNFVRQFANDSKIVPVNPIYEKNSESFYVLTKSSVIHVPISSCSIYTSCTNCNQPSKSCLWYHSRCVNREHVPNNERELLCQPEIYSYSPSSGPLEGGTLLTFHGLNFGISDPFHQNSDENNVKINVGSRSCEVVKRNNSLIQCRIEDNFQESPEYNASIMMEIKYLTDVIKFGYFIDGKVSAKEQFKFKNPDIRGIYPSYGPFAGGTKVMVYGSNLNVGTNISINFGGSPCQLLSRSESYAFCSTSSFLTTQLKVDSKQINVAIDSKQMVLNGDTQKSVKHDARPNKNCSMNIDHNDILFCKSINRFLVGSSELNMSESFQYLPNPSLQKTDNLNTIASGDTVMRFWGDSFGSSAFPMLVISSGQTPVLPLACNSSMNQTLLECLFPSSKDPFYGMRVRQLVGKELRYKLWFDNHAQTYPTSLVVYPNPIFKKFNTTRLASLQRRIVEFFGENLNNLPYQIEMLSPKNESFECEPFDTRTGSRLSCTMKVDEKTMNRISGVNLRVRIRIGRSYLSEPGVVRFESDNLSVMSIIGIIMTFFIVIGTIFIIIHYYCPSCKPVKPQNDPNEHEMLLWKPKLQHYFQMNTDDGKHSLELFDELTNKNMIIEPQLIKVDEQIGSGNFGLVLRGKYKVSDDSTIDVAIKVQKEWVGISFSAFIDEIRIMKEFNHENILCLLGITLYDKKPAILLPYMDGKDLKHFITNNDLKVKDLLDFGIQIAKGMTYLSERNFVHRDLALRNCMLQKGPPRIVKVADFGLTREFSNKQYYSQKSETQLPIKWMSPEAIRGQKFTIKSDVYSYGVTLWELMTRGNTPFEYVDPHNMLDELDRGRRLPRPDYCPDLIYVIMCKCWMPDPDARPTFRELYEELVETVEMLKNVENSQMHSYQNSYFLRFNSNPENIFDYNDPETFNIIHNAREEILQSKVGITFDPSAEFENESESPYQSINEEPPTYSAATSGDYQPINNGFLDCRTSKASAPPLSYNP